MHEAEKLVQEIGGEIRSLQLLLNYLEGQECWTEEDLGYCRNTLRRVARRLVGVSRGRLASLDPGLFRLIQ
ncbi:MAG: hypothetical protein COV76_00315 [Candidatus Omnitrophica bacterium CG11_big_fil_rev_8_21_14_0_20_64_10]|nr:MAG: hypothetical protein COV76_00315 [Candidatus Omnitrophica bacterium CG11_big_fil_rev_8_21_14_0_20_64_10]